MLIKVIAEISLLFFLVVFKIESISRWICTELFVDNFQTNF